MNKDLTVTTATNDELRVRGVECVSYDHEDFADEALAGALLSGRLDSSSVLEFSGGLEGEMVTGVEPGATYIGEADSSRRFTYRRAKGGGLGLDPGQATTLIQGHRGPITVRL